MSDATVVCILNATMAVATMALAAYCVAGIWFWPESPPPGPLLWFAMALAFWGAAVGCARDCKELIDARE